MPGNPKTSKWRATSQSERGRKKIQITLSDEARGKLERLVKAKGGGRMRSQVIEELIMRA